MPQAWPKSAKGAAKSYMHIDALYMGLDPIFAPF